MQRIKRRSKARTVLRLLSLPISLASTLCNFSNILYNLRCGLTSLQTLSVKEGILSLHLFQNFDSQKYLQFSLHCLRWPLRRILCLVDDVGSTYPRPRCGCIPNKFVYTPVVVTSNHPQSGLFELVNRKAGHEFTGAVEEAKSWLPRKRISWLALVFLRRSQVPLECFSAITSTIGAISITLLDRLVINGVRLSVTSRQTVHRSVFLTHLAFKGICGRLLERHNEKQHSTTWQVEASINRSCR